MALTATTTAPHHASPHHPSLLTLHLHHHTPCSHSQTLLARGFPPRRAAGVHSHLTLSHASHHPTNLSDSLLAGKDTCCLSPLAQETPSVPPRRSVLPSPPPAASSRCWSLPDVSFGRQGWRAPSVLPPGGTWALGPHNHPPPSIPRHANVTRTSYHTHTHTPLPAHEPWPPSREAKLCSIVVSSLPHLTL